MKKLARIILKLYFPCPSDDPYRNLKEKKWNFALACPDFAQMWPTQAEWIKRLMNDDYSKRPTATEILCVGKERKVFKVRGDKDARAAYKQCLLLEKERIRMEREHSQKIEALEKELAHFKQQKQKQQQSQK